MKEITVTLKFHVDETTEEGQELIEEVTSATIEEFKEDDEPYSTAQEYHYEIKDI